MFPVCTEEFFLHLKETLPSELPIEIAVDDAEYKEAALHSALIILGSIVAAGATLLVIPVVVNVVSEYINRRLFTDRERIETTVHWELTVVDGTRAAKLTYEGPAIDFASEMQQAIAQLPVSLPSASVPLMIHEKAKDEKPS